MSATDNKMGPTYGGALEVRHIMTEHRLTQAQLAEQAGIPRTIMSHLLNLEYHAKLGQALKKLVKEKTKAHAA